MDLDSSHDEEGLLLVIMRMVGKDVGMIDDWCLVCVCVCDIMSWCDVSVMARKGKGSCCGSPQSECVSQ